jgi:hypothetical protein
LLPEFGDELVRALMLCTGVLIVGINESVGIYENSLERRMLSFMKFVAGQRLIATRAKAFGKLGKRLAMSPLISVGVTNESCQFIRDQLADRDRTPGGQNPGMPNNVFVEAEREILLG